MSRLFYHVMQDNVGNLLFDVSGTMRIAGSGTLATIYGDEALTVILPNPMTNHPSFGSFKCYLGASAAGYDFSMAKSGYTFETLTGVQGLGTMAQQNANAVVIVGGSATSLTSLSATTAFINALEAQQVGAGLAIGGARLSVGVVRVNTDGMHVRPDADTGASVALRFFNAAGSQVGYIDTSATTTTYATTSDARLKHAITPLTGALDVVRALRPITHLWRADDSRGVGFLANEVQEVIPDGVITGARDAVDDEGRIVPQQIDMSKLVPWLTACCQELAQQVQALTARVATLEDGLGV